MPERTPKEYPLPVQNEQNEQIESLPRSLTEKILSLCGSGRFGVREAIAEATKRKRAVPPPQADDAQVAFGRNHSA